VVVVLGAVGLGPQWLRAGIAVIAARHRPWPRQRMVDGGDLVVQDVGIALVEIDALLDDGLVVVMQRQPVASMVRGPLKLRVSTSRVS